MPFRRRDVSAMVVADALYEKKCVFVRLKLLDYKVCSLDKCLCCHPEGRCGFSSTGSLEELSVTVTMCGKKCGL